MHYLKAKYRISDGYSKETKIRLQQEWSAKLLYYLRNGYEIIYLDECTVSPWPKAGVNYWINLDDPFYLKVSSGGFHSISVFGAISNK